MKIKRFISSRLESNGYILYQKGGENCYIIDPGSKHKVFLEFMKENNLKLKGILLTHHHYDHVGAVSQLKNETDCKVYIHYDDLDMYKDEAEPFEDGQVFDLEGEQIKAIQTKGHTKGSVCYYSGKSKIAFTGDTVFNVDLGRTDLEDGNWDEMRYTVKNILDSWDNDVTIYPGHGDSSSMKTVKRINKEYIEALAK